jgi:hypothetical protein
LGKDEFGVYKVEHIHISYAKTVEVQVEGKKKIKKVRQKKRYVCVWCSSKTIREEGTGLLPIIGK